MRQVIQKLLEVEGHAKDLVSAANAEAGQIIAVARREAAELVARTRADATREAALILERERVRAAEEEERQWQEAAGIIHRQLQLNADTLEATVAAVAQCVIETDSERGPV
jgi:vacuolar-type H+-ATPase subunit H